MPLIDPDTYPDKEFPRQLSAKQNLEQLQVIAYQLAMRKYNAYLKSFEQEDPKLCEVIERIALVMSKTYAALGDSFELADDQALIMIRDLLVDYNRAIINRNKRKRIPKELFQKWLSPES